MLAEDFSWTRPTRPNRPTRRRCRCPCRWGPGDEPDAGRCPCRWGPGDEPDAGADAPAGGGQVAPHVSLGPGRAGKPAAAPPAPGPVTLLYPDKTRRLVKVVRGVHPRCVCRNRPVRPSCRARPAQASKRARPTPRPWAAGATASIRTPASSGSSPSAHFDEVLHDGKLDARPAHGPARLVDRLPGAVRVPADGRGGRERGSPAGRSQGDRLPGHPHVGMGKVFDSPMTSLHRARYRAATGRPVDDHPRNPGRERTGGPEGDCR